MIIDTISFPTKIYGEDAIKYKNPKVQIIFEEIKQYLSLNEWQGKAGAYAIQGEGKRLVETIDGDLETVIGLPVNKLIKYLKDNEIL